MSPGRARHQLLIELAQNAPTPLVDVGADHGKVARAVDGIATERYAHRINGPGRWVVADGLQAFGPLGTVVIAGMGARTIARILGGAPPIQLAILHAQDDPPRLRRWLASSGWRIVEEHLAPEASRFAEVIVAEAGAESAQGLELHFGPRLIAGNAPLREAHFEQVVNWLDDLVHQAIGSEAEQGFRERLAFVRSLLR